LTQLAIVLAKLELFADIAEKVAQVSVTTYF
jgi:hypothetical protein